MSAPDPSPSRVFRRQPAARLILLATPPLLLITTYAVFQFAADSFGARWGYLVGFLFYWVFWCLLLPLGLLGPEGVARLFRAVPHPLGRPAWVASVLVTGNSRHFKPVHGSHDVCVLHSAALWSGFRPDRVTRLSDSPARPA